jgi:peptide/nickel transport system ATP-binding protein
VTLAATLPAERPATPAQPLIEVRGLAVEYGWDEEAVRAVDGIDLAIAPGEILGLAGESGSGKSTAANAIMQVLRNPAHIAGGEVLFQGEEITHKSIEQLRKYRWRNVSMVFQSAMNALNPVMRVGDQFIDMMHAHERISKRQAFARTGELLELVGIDPRRMRAYPHELSGGMRQRVIIAMALALEPELVIMDEPTTALDVVVQREILQQVSALQNELGFAVLFITHDLSLLVEIAHRIAIMYAGEIVEEAPGDEILSAPRHPYTVGLIHSFPPLRGPVVRMTGIPGAPPDLANPPSGCRFHPRCPHCVPDGSQLHHRQTQERPLLREVSPAHRVACHLVEEGGA